MRIATWNINSVRLRLNLIERLVTLKSPDVICLQETKVNNDCFPSDAFADMGYTHQHYNGMKSYNGVAILSRMPLNDPQIMHWQGKMDCRHIYATLPNGHELHCVYVPAGGDIPDPLVNPKFAHKLNFLDEMAAWWQANRTATKKQILVGDMNIAPLEQDVWSHKQLLGVVSHTPVEVQKLLHLQRTNDWVDSVRHFVPAEQKLYSWWSYRASDWSISNRGRRLDHIWVTPPLTSTLKATEILREARGWEPKPSDHVPVLIDLEG